MKKKGFTLVELIAIIVIMSIIALIAVPIIGNIITKSRKSIFESNINQIINAAVNKYAEEGFFEASYKIPEDKDIAKKLDNYRGKIYVTADEQIALVVDDGNFCGEKMFDSDLVIKNSGECNLDFEKPIAPIVELTKVAVGSDYITVKSTIKNSEIGISKIEYMINDEVYESALDETTYVFHNLKKNTIYTISVKVTAESGVSTTSEKLVITTGDITLPVYTISTTDWAKQKTLTITYPSGEGYTYLYSLDKGKTWESANQNQQLVFTENGIVVAKVSDGTNTIVASSYNVNKIDSVGPEIASIDGNTSKWEISKILTVNATDSLSGLNATAYSINGSAWQASNTFKVTENGTYTIRVRDKAGNESSMEIVVYRVDNEKPVITVEGHTTDYTKEINPTSSFNIPEAIVTDNSGEDIEAVVRGNVVPSIPGTYIITYEAEDLLGNKATLVLTVIVLKPYVITFNANGGETPSFTSLDIIRGEALEKLPTTTRNGYVFNGWYTAATGGAKITTSTIPASDTTYYAQWTANSYTYNIVYKSSSGTQLGTATATYNYGTTNTISPKEFTGYTTPASQSIAWNSTSAKTITFTYTPINYTLTYNANGGSVSPSSKTVAYNSSYGTLATPSRSGYSFVGWYTAASGGTKVTSSTLMGAASKTIYAHWSHTEYRYRDWVDTSGYVSNGVTSGSASSSAVSGTDSTYGAYKITGTLKETSVGDNYSNVQWSWKVSSATSGFAFSLYTMYYTVTVDGSVIANSSFFENGQCGNGVSGYSIANCTTISGSTTIQHNTDGTKTSSFSIKVWGSGGYSPGTMTSSGSITLTTTRKWQTSGYWGSWSSWSTTSYTSSSTRQVETRTVYDND